LIEEKSLQVVSYSATYNITDATERKYTNEQAQRRKTCKNEDYRGSISLVSV